MKVYVASCLVVTGNKKPQVVVDIFRDRIQAVSWMYQQIDDAKKTFPDCMWGTTCEDGDFFDVIDITNLNNTIEGLITSKEL